MAELILPENRHHYHDVIDRMHETRYKLFFDNLGWDPDECGVTRGFDKDAYDMDHSIYIVELTPAGDVAGFARLNPTSRKNMMADLFPEYCNYFPEPPCDPTIYEVSRLGYDPDVLGRDRAAWKETRGRMTSAITEFCLSRGIKQLTFIVHDNVFLSIQRDTWGAMPLGNPQPDEKLGKIYQAGISDINAEGLARCRSLLMDPNAEILTYYGPLLAEVAA